MDAVSEFESFSILKVVLESQATAVGLAVVTLASHVGPTYSLDLEEVEVVAAQLEGLVVILELGVVDFMASVAELWDLAGHLEVVIMDLVVVITVECEVAMI